MTDHDALRIRDTSATDVAIDPAPRRRRKRIALASVVLAVVAGVGMLAPGMASWMTADRSVALERLRLATVERGDFIRDIGVEGRVIAAVSPTLYATATGTLALAVQPGDEVSRDQELARLDSPEVEAEYAQELANLQRIEVELERQRIQARVAAAENQQTLDLAEVTLQAAEREMRRAEKSFANQSISESDYERYRDDLARAKVEFRHAGQDAELEAESLAFEIRTRELELERQQLVADNLKRRVSELVVRSPVNGVVGSIVVQDRAAVAPNQALMTVVDLSALEVEIGIPETYADDLGIGMNTEIRYGGARYEGVLSALSPQVVDNEVVGRVRFANEAPAGIRQNQRVQARILIDELRDVLKLRRGPFTDSGGGRVAYVLGDDGQARRRAIELGARSIGEIQIVGGLREGERVIISSTAEFDNAETVRVVD